MNCTPVVYIRIWKDLFGMAENDLAHKASDPNEFHNRLQDVAAKVIWIDLWLIHNICYGIHKNVQSLSTYSNIIFM